MTVAENKNNTLSFVAVLCLGIILTVLAVVSSSVVVAWSAGGITVGSVLALWR